MFKKGVFSNTRVRATEPRARWEHVNPVLWAQKNRAVTPDEAAKQRRALNYTQADSAARDYKSRMLQGILIEQLASDFTENLLISPGITTWF